ARRPRGSPARCRRCGRRPAPGGPAWHRWYRLRSPAACRARWRPGRRRGRRRPRRPSSTTAPHGGTDPARRSRAKPHGRARQGNGCNWSWKVTPCSMRGGRGLVDQDQVVAAYDGAAVVETEQPLDLLAVAAGDALQVAGVVLDQAAANAAALPADQVDQGVVAEVAFHPDDAAGQQRGAALGQRLAGTVVDPQLAAAGRLVAEPQLAR